MFDKHEGSVNTDNEANNNGEYVIELYEKKVLYLLNFFFLLQFNWLLLLLK